MIIIKYNLQYIFQDKQNQHKYNIMLDKTLFIKPKTCIISLQLIKNILILDLVEKT